MCDTPVTDPFSATLAAFFSVKEWKYYSNTYQCWATLKFSGDPTTTLQEPVGNYWIVGPHRPAFGEIMARWTKGTSDSLTMNFIQSITNPTTPPLATVLVCNFSNKLKSGGDVIIENIDIVIDDLIGFSNNQSGKDTLPCCLYLSKLDTSSAIGKISGKIIGSSYNADPYDSLTYPIHGPFDNVSLYISKKQLASVEPNK